MDTSRANAGRVLSVGNAQESMQPGTAVMKTRRNVLFVLAHIEARIGNACDIRTTSDTSPTGAEMLDNDSTLDRVMTTSRWKIR